MEESTLILLNDLTSNNLEYVFKIKKFVIFFVILIHYLKQLSNHFKTDELYRFLRGHISASRDQLEDFFFSKGWSLDFMVAIG